MAVIASTRELLPTFTHRVVVCESSIIISSRQELMFRVSIDFGINGRLALFATIQIQGRDITETIGEIEAHINDVKIIIEGLESFNRWAGSERPDRFLQTLLAKRPIMLVGDRTDRKVKLGVYGEDLLNLSIVVDSRKDPGIGSLTRKVSEITMELSKHIKAISEIDLKDIANCYVPSLRADFD